MEATATYSVGTWDPEHEAYTPQRGVPGFNLTLWDLKRALVDLRNMGYECHRLRDPDGSHDTNDWAVLVERTDGKSESEIREQWKR